MHGERQRKYDHFHEAAEVLFFCLPSGCTPASSSTYNTVINEAHDHLQAADKCNLLCAPVKTIMIWSCL